MDFIMLKINEKKIKDLIPYINNAKEHPEDQINQIAGSIKEFGFNVPILIDSENQIIAGHGRFLAAQKLKLKTIPCIELKHLDEIQKKAFILADNKLNLNTGFNLDILNLEIENIINKKPDFDFNNIGFSVDEIDEILKKENVENEVEYKTDQDEIPITAPEICKKGQIWKLGNHRLMCGDSTNQDDLKKLLNGNLIDQLITDPPYGVDYSSKNEFLNCFDKGNSNQRKIVNDAIKNYREFFSNFLKIIPFAEYNTIYISMSGLELHNLRLAFDDVKIKWGDYLVWVKNNHVLGRKDYNSKYEFIVYGWKNKHKFYGDFSTTILEYNRPQKSDLHPTMKPVELWERLMNDGSKKGANIYDAFSGSGTTFIAGEKQNRNVFGMEFEEHYCDVIIKRWEDFTGKKAELIK